MKEKKLPIGTIVKTKNGKLAIITGHFLGRTSLADDYSVFYDYNVTAYPFGCEHTENDFKMFKRYDWFDFGLSAINASDVEEVIFMGYQGE